MKRQKNIDRGWAWLVMMSSYIGMVIYCVPLYMSGVLYIALLEKFNKGEAKTSLIGAVSSGLLCFAAPLGGVINNRFSCRVSIVLGGALTTIGFAASAFVPSLDWMLVTAGIFVGFGFAISSSGLICVVGFYFEKWRESVISCAFLTVGLAMFISAPFGIHLLAEYGLNTAFLILAGIQAQMCVCGMISKPSSIEIEVHAQKKRDRKVKGESTSKTYLDVTLMKNISYTCYLISISTWNFGLCVAIMHLPNYVSILGGSNRDIGLLMTSFSVANTIGRLLGSLTISKMSKKCLHVYAGVLGLTGTLTSLFIFYSDFTGGTYIFAIQLGMFTGWPNSMMTPLSLRFVGVHKLSEAYGLAYVFCGLGVSTGPVLIGYLYVVTGSYKYSFVVAGVVLCLGCLSGVCSICCRHDSTTDDRTTEVVVITKDKYVVAKSLQVGDDSSMEYKMTESENHFDSYSSQYNYKKEAITNGTCVQQQGLDGEEAYKLLTDEIR
ncbi:monocarboxylate transporter 12-like [Mercenaria mercenaria]|uniref:monocarboxylate transporter 12-like n=1 Tax=Mercenaria mercenaria TaxID=6596 RepID=UPI00234F2786|nr:monocarboxylate transporter 12-like [Mercenaria mercenaria]XP_045200005.2 monocarboxylate transporter 12-like [Mercenaria mercenaria]XP_045200006.2 monocarboxylate transporter 12-like [Mercenaria mercenaria]XP_045200007.2 monocarboxylate transporter 12-like [Mercenaria mercenaria]XP_045200009.2 monocarboxylate transporter 12-like [Mercenaria mercenaria]XP_045200010.2 monocarboxylate transporter 12-like [Mercenaria mercenaria]XP_053404386.1 monocarboxylate transporter 12-like [Mercenaria me